MKTTKKLSKREQEVTDLLILGLTNKEIAKELQISVHTVKAHLEEVFYKMKVANRVQLAVKITLEKYSEKE